MKNAILSHSRTNSNRTSCSHSSIRMGESTRCGGRHPHSSMARYRILQQVPYRCHLPQPSCIGATIGNRRSRYTTVAAANVHVSKRTVTCPKTRELSQIILCYPRHVRGIGASRHVEIGTQQGEKRGGMGSRLFTLSVHETVWSEEWHSSSLPSSLPSPPPSIPSHH